MLNNELTFRIIKEIVCQEEGLSPENFDLNLTRRKKEYVIARFYMMYFLKKYTTMSLATSGNHLGAKRHCDVLYGIRTVNDLSCIYKNYSDKVSVIDRYIKLKIDGEEIAKEQEMNLIKDHIMLCINTGSPINPDLISNHNNIVKSMTREVELC